MPIAIRPATSSDIVAMAILRAETWGSEEYWQARIRGYLEGKHSPQQALAERTAFVAVADTTISGFVAGHRTRRFGCDGELEWINVSSQHRGRGIADRLFGAISAWFVEQRALRVCVNVAPENAIACRFYARHGAVPLNAYWMIWEDLSASRGC
jgi:ribosomal protein S18 acetylase RimI-like enzyme